MRAARIALMVGGVLVGLLLAEGGLRLVYPALPSLAALSDSPYQVERFRVDPNQQFDDGTNCEGFVLGREARDARIGPEPHAGQLWVIGDSVSWGMGVKPAETYAQMLGERFAEETGQGVRLRNLSMPGAGFCMILRRLNTELSRATPDAVVMGLFADDLEAYALLAYDGHLIALPDTIQRPPLRWLAGRSYLVNIAWFAVATRQDGPLRFIDGNGRGAFTRHMGRVLDRLEDKGVSVVIALIPPVGAADCPPDPPLKSRCRWMLDDLDLLAEMVDELGVEAVDLRELWAEGDSRAMGLAVEQTLELVIHPNADGHRALSEAIWTSAGSSLTSALSASPASTVTP
ncbi:MAG: SGNH/GDSL hydrolase family protein [Myxococcota bacterium]